MGIPQRINPSSPDYAKGWECRRSFMYGKDVELVENGNKTTIDVSYQCSRILPDGGQREVSYIVSFPIDTSNFDDYARRALISLLQADRL